MRKHSPCPVIDQCSSFDFIGAGWNHVIVPAAIASEIKTDHHISPHTYTTSRISSRDPAFQVAPRTVCSSTRDNGKTESNIALLCTILLKKGFGLSRSVVRKIVHACHDWSTRRFSVEYRVSVKGYSNCWPVTVPAVLFHSSLLRFNTRS